MLPGERPESLPPTLVALLRMAPEAGQRVNPMTVLSMVGFDRVQVESYLVEARSQVMEWSSAADQADAVGDPEEADACRYESAGWWCTAEDLRAALDRFV